MPYDIKITDIETSEILKTTIEELKELRKILKPYETKVIELEVKKIKKNRKVIEYEFRRRNISKIRTNRKYAIYFNE